MCGRRLQPRIVQFEQDCDYGLVCDRDPFVLRRALGQDPAHEGLSDSLIKTVTFLSGH